MRAFAWVFAGTRPMPMKMLYRAPFAAKRIPEPPVACETLQRGMTMAYRPVKFSGTT